MREVPFDLYRTNIPPDVIAQLPESVARESRVVPVRANGFELVVAMVDLEDRETLAKLRFILNREVASVFATREAIRFAIEKYYPA